MELLDLDSYSLLHILSFLNQKDVQAVSNTCTRLEEICVSTKSLWGTSFTLKLGQETEELERKRQLTEDDKELPELIGDRMLDMNISLDFSEVKDFDLQPLDTECLKWNLRKFSFEAVNLDVPSITRDGTAIQTVSRKYARAHVPKIPRSAMELLSKCLQRTNALEILSFSAHSFSRLICRKYRNHMLELLRCGNFDHSLKSLSLDCFFSSHRFHKCPGIWYDCRGMYEICESFSPLIGRFKNLQKLDINFVYLDDTLLQALAQPGDISLQSMTILLDLSSGQTLTAWPQLVESSPSLKVTLEATYSTSYDSILYYFPECVPIVNFKIYSLPELVSCDRSDLEPKLRLLSMYEKTLESVAIQNGPTRRCRSAIYGMVARCPKLHTLYLQGKIFINTILKLASMNKQWLKLGVSEKDIIFPKSWNESRQKNITRLCEEVSETLGREWKPEPEETFRTVFSHPVLM